MCGKDHSTLEKISMALADEIEGVEFYSEMIESMPPNDPAIPKLKEILEDERQHAKYFHAELGKHLI